MSKYNFEIKSKYYKIGIALFFIIFLFIYTKFCYVGFYGYDDLLYSQLANDWTKGIVNWKEHFSFRFGIVGLTALSYKLLGVSDFSSILPTLIINTCSIIFLYKLTKHFAIASMFLVLAFFTLDSWTISYTSKVMADSYITLSVLISIYAMYKVIYKGGGIIKYSLLFAIGVLFGILSKENIILLAPVYGVLLMIFFTQKNEAFTMWSIAFTCIFILLYLICLYLITGDVMFRLESIFANSYLNSCSYADQSLAILKDRIAIGFWKLLLNSNVIICITVGIPVLILNIKSAKSFLLLKTEYSFFSMVFILMLLSSNFMSISYKNYNPMCLDIRHFLFIVPFAGICFALIMEFVKSKKEKLGILISFATLCYIAYQYKLLNINYYWIPLFIVIIISLFFSKKHTSVFIAICSSLIFVYGLKENYIYAKAINYNEQKKISKNLLLLKDCSIVTDDVQKRLLFFYNSFQQLNDIEIIDFDEYEIKKFNIKYNTLVYLQNIHTQNLARIKEENIPAFLKQNTNPEKNILHSYTIKYNIYKVENYKNPVLIRNINIDYEKEKANKITNEIVKENTSNKRIISNQNNLLVFELGNLYPKENANYLIKYSFALFTENNPNGILTIRVVDNDSIYHKESFALNNFVLAPFNWFKVNSNLFIKKKKLSNNAIIEFEILNSDNQLKYIDNWQISTYLFSD